MARGRMLSRAISLDEKVDGLPDDTSRLLFTWLIPHLDCEGRMYGDAQAVKSIVFPRRSIPTLKIEKILSVLDEAGLIIRYSVNGNEYLTMPGFEKHQIGLRKDRESSSQIPSITPESLQSNSDNSPAQVKSKLKSKLSISKDKYGEFANVLLTDNEYKKLVEKFGEEGANLWIITLSEGKELKGYTYKNDYLAILKWERRDGKDETRGQNGANRQGDSASRYEASVGVPITR